MASYSISRNLEASKVIKSIKIWALQSSSSSTSSPRNVTLCNLTVDYFSSRLLLQNHANFKLSGAPIHLGTGNQRSIAWIDEEGKCFFPKQFIGDEFEDNDVENPKIEIEIEMKASSEPKLGKRMREEEKMVQDQEDKKVTSSYRHGEMSKRQRIINDSKPENPRWPNTKLLREEDSAYTIVRNIFLPGIRKIHPGAIIATIHQCSRMRPLEKAHREIFSKQMEITKAARGTSNTVYAWFGASAQAIACVLAHGFGVAGKLSGSDANAVGVRLSPLANPFRSAMQSEADDNGEKHMILCRVILGNVEKVEAGSQQYYPSSEFDTGADDPKNPKWYVVWSTNISRHILPDCVVSFKTSANKQAALGGFARTKYTFAELFSKIKSSLPPVKVQECITLYDSLKAGNISKDIFIKQFRLVAGEKVLLSAIREICGSE
ncbi:probable inactive poly [ADP-ribose] polymerase SRO3 isoform X2 [Humulus lupulus]|uniref:probable inactive poly [ADP-ribose] polymerase SRO3 isoform X2 n=1 Tax=Humulus lupulus TaxID=3486 RepID=UPI002B401C04|nr:probable inactive poly [ADP-ribose] polymerase SRO3 isoform X2 [Humulus lupulus]